MSKVNNNDCYFNSGVECSENKCGLCGWNPAVSEKRINNIKVNRQNKERKDK